MMSSFKLVPPVVTMTSRGMYFASCGKGNDNGWVIRFVLHAMCGWGSW